ncbi:excisionase family DNA-binding protein [Tropicimonas sp. TH_r6]|uniref:excisionase family DNA-binding protein n=1 Tax=Tropicimonas sp. TH_r6 TaxID=3082085 RepID=UPI003987BC0C
MDPIYTPRQLADRWGCSVQTVRDTIVGGKLRSFRVGRLMRIPSDAVLTFERRK